MNTLLTIIISFASSAISGFFGWFFGRKKQKSEELKAAVESWNLLKESLETDIVGLVEQHKKDTNIIKELSEKIEIMNIEITELKNKVETLRIQNKYNKK